MVADVGLAVVGAGLIGRCHAAAIIATPGARLACIVDPADAARAFAKTCGVACYATMPAMFERQPVDGVILATPNQLHVQGALMCVARRCPVLVEKPLATSVAQAQKLVEACQRAGVPILTGHHRRHGARVQKARSIIERGLLGQIVSAQCTCWFHKPRDYFDVAWRAGPGGGPVLINLIHDINTMQYLMGPVARVQAMASNRTRGLPVEDTAAILLGFASGALASITVSDTITAPWSWEMTAGENPAFPETGVSSTLIGGTQASLSLPDLSIWRHAGAPNWLTPIKAEITKVETHDPLVAQVRQFMAVICDDAPPLVSGEDGLQTLRVIEAVKRAFDTGCAVALAPDQAT
jgi:predicted dehydrogenase